MEEWLNVIGQTIAHEFSDLTELSEIVRMVLRMLLEIILGGLLGYERERRGRAAGLRTHMLVALGSALFVLVPIQSGITTDSLSRVLQGVTSGIGFLGAGAIIKLSEGRPGIRGLTTAASIWLTAAIGVAAGMGHAATAILATLFALFILSTLRRSKLHIRHEVD